MPALASGWGTMSGMEWIRSNIKVIGIVVIAALALPFVAAALV